MINIICDFFSSSGYAVHARGIANALSKITDVRVSAQIVPNWEKLVNDRELSLLKKKPEKDEINLIITMPPFWRMNTTAKRNWAFLVWEGDKVPKSFIEDCINPDIEYIFVPSAHTRQALMNTIGEYAAPRLPKVLEESDTIRRAWKLSHNENLASIISPKIKLIPHGVDLNLFYPKEKPNKTVFLCNKGWRNLQDRGGIQYALQAYFEEFSSKDNVEMIIKVNPSYGIPDINRMISEIAKGNTNIGRVTFDTTFYKYEDLVRLYNAATVFVSPTRAEAFNIPCIEAMACGLPVITTNFGGQAEFCDNETGWIVSGKIEEVKHEIAYEGISWLTPDIMQLRKAMREAYEKPGICAQKGNVGLSRAIKWTWDESVKKIKECV